MVVPTWWYKLGHVAKKLLGPSHEMQGWDCSWVKALGSEPENGHK